MYQVEILSVETRHVLAVANLPNHHGDPFDRMLIAQTIVEGMSLLSCDVILDRYGVARLW